METLVKIQNELKVPKGNLNKFGNYKYRSAEDILEAVKPILLKYNAYLLLTDRVNQLGTRLFMQSTASLYFKGEKIMGLPSIFETQGFAELAEHKGMSAEQATGTASSYARKYALNGLFLIDETESDADSQQPEPKKERVDEILLTASNDLKACKNLAQLSDVFLKLTPKYKTLTETLKNELKVKFEKEKE